VLVTLLIGLLVAAGWWATGGRWARVETPSMGTRAPVGSLVWTRPAQVRDLRAGDFVTFRSPRDPGQTYSHLVLATSEDGSFTTRGLLSGEDGWTVQQDQLVGRVVSVWRGAGWVALMSPLLIVGCVGVALLTRRLPRHHHGAVAVVGAAVVLSLALLVYRPLTQADQLSFGVAGDHARAVWVNAGLLPLRLAAGDGKDSDVMRSGETAVVQVATPVHGRYVVHVRPAVSGWWLAGLALLCFLPAMIETARRRPRIAR
jgi:hypothetical protein